MEKIANKFDLPDQCRSYKQLTSSKRRFDAPNSRSNVNCDKSGQQTQQEDWQGEGFYRIEGGAGTKLSENCGSSVNILRVPWLKRSLDFVSRDW